MDQITRVQKWGTLVSCSISCFVGFLDFAIVNTAIPSIQENFSASILQLQWIMNAFILTMSVLLASMGRIADLLGRRLINGIGLLIFLISSLAAALAVNPDILIISRIFQGIGIAAIIPSSMALINHAFSGNEKNRALGIWGSITGIGLASGPVVGGILVSALTWRWIFYINLPFGVASLILNSLFVRESRDLHSKKRIDPKGFLLLTIGLVSLVSAFMHVPDWGWDSWSTLLLFAIAVISLVLFYFSENKSPHPIVPFASFSNKTFLSCCFVMFCLVFILSSSLFFMPLYLQNLRHQDPYIVGFMLLPITGTIVLFSPLVGQWMHKVSSKKLMMGGLLFFSLSALMQGFFHLDSATYFILISFAFMGIGWVLARTPALVDALSTLPEHLAGTAAGVLWTIQNTGGAIGLALTGILFRSLYQETDLSFLSGYHAVAWLQGSLALFVFFYLAFFLKKTLS